MRHNRSIAIQEALDSDCELPQPLYFYCSRNPAEPERAKAEDIARSLVKQLSTIDTRDGLNLIPQDVVDKYEKAQEKGFPAGRLDFIECYDLISTFVSRQGRALILVDALDECTGEASHLLVSMFNDIVGQQSTVVKLMISSRTA